MNLADDMRDLYQWAWKFLLIGIMACLCHLRMHIAVFMDETIGCLGFVLKYFSPKSNKAE